MSKKTILQELEEYFLKVPEDKIKEDWDALSMYDNVGMTCDEFLENMRITNLQPNNPIKNEIANTHTVGK